MSDRPETAFEIGDRVEVCDPIHEIPYAEGQIDGIYPLDCEYDIRLDNGERLDRVSEVQLIEAADV